MLQKMKLRSLNLVFLSSNLTRDSQKSLSALVSSNIKLSRYKKSLLNHILSTLNIFNFYKEDIKLSNISAVTSKKVRPNSEKRYLFFLKL